MVLCFLSLLTWIWISCCNFPSNSLFQIYLEKGCWNGQQIRLVVLCFISQLTWIFISVCISPFNLLFWRNVFDLLPQLKTWIWLSCYPGCFASYHNLPEFWYLDAFLKFYLKKCCSNGQQIWLVDRSSKIFDLLPQLKDWKWLSCYPGCFVSYHNLPEFWYLDAFLPSICFSQVLSKEMLLERSTNQFVDRSSSKKGSFRLIMALEGIASQWM